MQKVADNIFALLLIGTGGMIILVGIFITFFIKHQRKLLRQREAMQKRELAYQKELLSAVIQSQENERKRIGQDLHDDVGAALSGLRFAMDMYSPPPSHTEPYEKHSLFCKSMIDKVINDVRHISHNLSPASLNFKGLQAALESSFQLLNKAGKIAVTFNNDVRENILESLDMQVSTAIYRVLQELLNNTIKHSGATAITINFSEEGNQLLIRYADNGIGLPDTGASKTGMGFHNIESRLSVINAYYRLEQPGTQGFMIYIVCTLVPHVTLFHAEN